MQCFHQIFREKRKKTNLLPNRAKKINKNEHSYTWDNPVHGHIHCMHMYEDTHIHTLLQGPSRKYWLSWPHLDVERLPSLFWGEGMPLQWLLHRYKRNLTKVLVGNIYASGSTHFPQPKVTLWIFSHCNIHLKKILPV